MDVPSAVGHFQQRAGEESQLNGHEEHKEEGSPDHMQPPHHDHHKCHQASRGEHVHRDCHPCME